MDIDGLPLHPLVVHAAVILGPVAALAALLYVGVRRWHDRLRWPMLAAALLSVAAIYGAYLTGGHFQDANSFFAHDDLVEKHAALADKLLIATIVFGVLALLSAVLHRRPGVLRILLQVLLGLGAVVVLVLVVLTGEAGARAVWHGVNG